MSSNSRYLTRPGFASSAAAPSSVSATQAHVSADLLPYALGEDGPMPHPRVGLVPPRQTGYPYLGQPAPTWASSVTPSTGAPVVARIEHPGAWHIPEYLGPDIFGCGASRLGHNFVAFAQQEGYQREAVGSMPYGSARWPVTGFIPQDSLPPDVLVSDHDVTAALLFLATVRQDWAQLGEALHELYPVVVVDLAHLEALPPRRLIRLVQCQFQQVALA